MCPFFLTTANWQSLSLARSLVLSLSLSLSGWRTHCTLEIIDCGIWWCLFKNRSHRLQFESLPLSSLLILIQGKRIIPFPANQKYGVLITSSDLTSWARIRCKCTHLLGDRQGLENTFDHSRGTNWDEIDGALILIVCSTVSKSAHYGI